MLGMSVIETNMFSPKLELTWFKCYCLDVKCLLTSISYPRTLRYPTLKARFITPLKFKNSTFCALPRQHFGPKYFGLSSKVGEKNHQCLHEGCKISISPYIHHMSPVPWGGQRFMCPSIIKSNHPAVDGITIVEQLGKASHK